MMIICAMGAGENGSENGPELPNALSCIPKGPFFETPCKAFKLDQVNLPTTENGPENDQDPGLTTTPNKTDAFPSVGKEG